MQRLKTENKSDGGGATDYNNNIIIASYRNKRFCSGFCSARANVYILVLLYYYSFPRKHVAFVWPVRGGGKAVVVLYVVHGVRILREKKRRAVHGSKKVRDASLGDTHFRKLYSRTGIFRFSLAVRAEDVLFEKISLTLPHKIA